MKPRHWRDVSGEPFDLLAASAALLSHDIAHIHVQLVHERPGATPRARDLRIGDWVERLSHQHGGFRGQQISRQLAVQRPHLAARGRARSRRARAGDPETRETAKLVRLERLGNALGTPRRETELMKTSRLDTRCDASRDAWLADELDDNLRRQA